jgi:hypothetical protein
MQGIVERETIDLINNIRINLGRTGTNATLETSQSLRSEITKEGAITRMKLFGRPYFFTVETGRKPTPGKKPSRLMIERITEWTQARGISEEAVWAIAVKIQEKGTKLWQDGGRDDIVPPAVDEFINNVSLGLLDERASEFQIKIRGFEW